MHCEHRLLALFWSYASRTARMSAITHSNGKRQTGQESQVIKLLVDGKRDEAAKLLLEEVTAGTATESKLSRPFLLRQQDQGTLQRACWLFAEDGNLQAVQLLEKAGVDVAPLRKPSASSIIHDFARQGDLEALKWCMTQSVVREKLKASLKSAMGMNPLQLAFSNLVSADIVSLSLARQTSCMGY